jgi:peptidoglycan-N-acetylglucosamine deacetylase
VWRRAAVVAATAWCAPAAAPVVPPVARAFGLPLRIDDGIAITFDDGPHPQGTPAVLDALQRAGVVATFFLVGEQVERNPSLAAEIAAAGHEVALHGHLHRLMLRRAPAAVREDCARALDAIGRATGLAPTLYRPPYGVFSLAGLAEVRRRGWRPFLWSRWGRDWERTATPASIARLAGRGLRNGDVVLLHDADDYSSDGSWRRTAAALPEVLEAALSTGDPVVTVSQST